MQLLVDQAAPDRRATTTKAMTKARGALPVGLGINPISWQRLWTDMILEDGVLAFDRGILLVPQSDDAHAYRVSENAVTIVCEDLGLMVAELADRAGDVSVEECGFAGYLLGHATADGQRRALTTALWPIADVAGTVWAADAQSGDELWHWAAPDKVEGAVVIAGGTVYVGSADGSFTALSAASGSERWTVHSGQAIKGHATVNGGFVYVGSNDRTIYAIEVDDGTVAWQYETSDGVMAAPVVHEGLVIIAAADGTITALKAP